VDAFYELLLGARDWMSDPSTAAAVYASNFRGDRPSIRQFGALGTGYTAIAMAHAERGDAAAAGEAMIRPLEAIANGPRPWSLEMQMWTPIALVGVENAL